MLLRDFHLNGDTLGFHPQTHGFYSIINSITGNYSLVAFFLMVTLLKNFINLLKSQNYLVRYSVINSTTGKDC